MNQLARHAPIKKQLKIKKRGVPPRSTKRIVGSMPGWDLNERPNSPNSLQPFRFSFGYATAPAMLPPYWGIPKLPIALSYVPLILSGDVTVKLFFSTTNLAADRGTSDSSRNPSKYPGSDLLTDLGSSIITKVKQKKRKKGQMGNLWNQWIEDWKIRFVSS